MNNYLLLSLFRVSSPDPWVSAIEVLLVYWHTVIILQMKYMSAAKMKLMTDTGILLAISRKMKQET
jgi:hypothetical protein